MDEQKFNFNEFEGSELDHWSMYWDEKKSYPQNILNLIQSVVWLPNERDYLIATAYILSPSAMCSRLPILALFGESGTGKSTLGKVGNIVYFGGEWQKASVSPNETAAALRNIIAERKYYGSDIDETAIERPTILVWDDIDPNVLLLNDAIFRLLKIGCDRSTDTMRIASGNTGENMEFRVFTGKVVSSITPWWDHYKLKELKRRVLPIQCKKCSNNVELLNLEDIDFFKFNSEYSKYWHNKERCLEFKKHQRSIKRKNGVLRKLSTMDIATQWSISHDPIATLVTTRLVSPSESVEVFNEYWRWNKEHLSESSAFIGLLRELVSSYSKEQELAIKAGLGDSITLTPKLVKEKVSEWTADGMLETRATPEALQDAMGILGYQLTKDGWVKK